LTTGALIRSLYEYAVRPNWEPYLRWLFFEYRPSMAVARKCRILVAVERERKTNSSCAPDDGFVRFQSKRQCVFSIQTTRRTTRPATSRPQKQGLAAKALEWEASFLSQVRRMFASGWIFFEPLGFRYPSNFGNLT